MRLAKAFKAAGRWTQDLIDDCEAAANTLLGVAQGQNDDELRAETWKRESPRGFDITSLGTTVRMCPC